MSVGDDDELTSREVLRDLATGGAFARFPRPSPSLEPKANPNAEPKAETGLASVHPDFVFGRNRGPRPSPELRPVPAAPPAPRKKAALPPAPALPEPPPPPSAHDEFVKRFLRERPKARTIDAEIAWGAAERASTLEI